MTEQQRISNATAEIVKAIYFADSSDYLQYLWSALNELDPEASKLLEENEKTAFDKYSQL